MTRETKPTAKRPPRQPHAIPEAPPAALQKLALELEQSNGNGETDAEKLWRDGFRERLRAVIGLLDLKNRDVARTLNISEQRVSNWVTPGWSRAVPQMYYVSLFCDRYGVSADYLLRGQISALTKRLADDLERASAGGAAGRRERARTRS